MLRLMIYDLRLLVRSRLSLVVLSLGLIIAAIAALNGAAWRSQMAESRSAFLELTSKSEGEYRARFAGAEWTDVDSADAPYTTRRAFAFPVPLLVDFSVGRSAIEPSMGQVRMGFRSDKLFRNYQIDNPDRMVRGRIDLTFFAIVIAPLLLIGLGYGVLATDRDQGTFRLLSAQAGNLRRLVVARSLNRLALVAIPLVVAVVLLSVTGPQIEGRTAAITLWLVVAFVGLLFWWSIILLVNMTRATAETAAFTLIALWALLTFVAPPLIAAAASAAHPPPSRMAQIIDGRIAEQKATDNYANDHPTDGLPELQRVKDVIAEYHRITNGLERSIRPVSERFDTALADQQAVVRTLQYVAPPAALASTLSSIGQTDAERYTALRRSARAYLYDYNAALDRGIADNRLFMLADHDNLPRFTAPKPTAPSYAGAIWTALLTSVFFLIAARGLARAKPD